MNKFSRNQKINFYNYNLIINLVVFKNDFGSLFSSWWRQFKLKKHLWNQKEVGGFNHLEVFSLICLCFISIVQSFFHRVASTLYLVLQYADHLLCHVQWPTGHQAKSEVMLSCQLAKFLALFITLVTMVQLHTLKTKDWYWWYNCFITEIKEQ